LGQSTGPYILFPSVNHVIEQTKIAKQMCHYAVQCCVMLCNAMSSQSPDVTYIVMFKNIYQ